MDPRIWFCFTVHLAAAVLSDWYFSASFPPKPSNVSFNALDCKVAGMYSK